MSFLFRVGFLFIFGGYWGINSKSIGNQIPEFLKADFFKIYRGAAVETREFQQKPVEPSNVTYYLYTIDNPDKYIKFNGDDLSPLVKKKSKYVFFIHGWTNDREVEWYENLKNAFLTTFQNEYSIIQVDWKEPANQLYYVSSINTYDVAKIIAGVVVKLNKEHGVKLDDILLIGHSLGGQITGFVGKQIQKTLKMKLKRIIALDPAGPLFDTRPDDKRLNKNDAEIVEVIHSDGGTFGYKDPCGTIDFFPNGGQSQPGCKRIDLLDISSVTEPITCDHHRAYNYFVEAILNPGEMVGQKCEDWDHFKNNKCGDVKVAMGDLNIMANGKFYLETNRDTPFSKSGKNSDENNPSVSLGKKVLNVLKTPGFL